MEAAVLQPAEDAARRILKALKDLGRTAVEVMIAALELGGSAIALTFTLLLEWFPGSYRPLDDRERGEAKKVFGNSIDLGKVRLAELSLPVDLIQLANNERPFTTMYLINFASWNDLDDATLIHELTHVWQGVVAGPIYMVEALEAQITEGDDAYDYGYTNARNGEGGQANLEAAGGDFNAFNREQQANIIEHYYIRKFVDKDVVPKPDVTAWEPYSDLVHA